MDEDVEKTTIWSKRLTWKDKLFIRQRPLGPTWLSHLLFTISHLMENYQNKYFFFSVKYLFVYFR